MPDTTGAAAKTVSCASIFPYDRLHHFGSPRANSGLNFALPFLTSASKLSTGFAQVLIKLEQVIICAAQLLINDCLKYNIWLMMTPCTIREHFNM
jgi:hypothetical protein